MKARRVFGEKHVLADGSLIEMVIWQLPEKTVDRPHGIKYRLYYGLPDGTCVVRYDNELGKGDHRHFGGVEEPYQFLDVETLMTDFMTAVRKARGFRDEEKT